MAGRVEGKVAIVVGAGQTPGETIGNGRATAMLLAREGARVVVVDREESHSARYGGHDRRGRRRSAGISCRSD